MSAPEFRVRESLARFGLKGPAAPQWLAAHGIVVPKAANSWCGAVDADDAAIFVARLGTAEFFLEGGVGGTALGDIEPAPETHPAGVYPVLREDAAFLLSGAGSEAVLAQVCHVNFADLALESRPMILTTMISVSVLVAPQAAGSGRQYRIWCDPTFGHYLHESLAAVVSDCGGNARGTST
jgi:sarcosine oxidase subunit gamma